MIYGLMRFDLFFHDVLALSCDMFIVVSKHTSFAYILSLLMDITRIGFDLF